MLSLTTADLSLDGVGERRLTTVKTEVFETFCRLEYGSVVNALSWTLGDSDLAADAANEAFARAYERWDVLCSERSGANPAGWVYTTGLNWARRRIRRRRRERELTSGFVVPPPEIGVDHLDLRRALIELPIKYRAVVVLRLLLQHTEAETATVLGIELGTVKSRLSRGLEHLRVQLTERRDDG